MSSHQSVATRIKGCLEDLIGLSRQNVKYSDEELALIRSSDLKSCVNLVGIAASDAQISQAFSRLCDQGILRKRKSGQYEVVASTSQTERSDTFKEELERILREESYSRTSRDVSLCLTGTALGESDFFLEDIRSICSRSNSDDSMSRLRITVLPPFEYRAIYERTRFRSLPYPYQGDYSSFLKIVQANFQLGLKNCLGLLADLLKIQNEYPKQLQVRLQPDGIRDPFVVVGSPGRPYWALGRFQPDVGCSQTKPFSSQDPRIVQVELDRFDEIWNRSIDPRIAHKAMAGEVTIPESDPMRQVLELVLASPIREEKDLLFHVYSTSLQISDWIHRDWNLMRLKANQSSAINSANSWSGRTKFV